MTAANRCQLCRRSTSPIESLDSFSRVDLKIAGGVWVESWPVSSQFLSTNFSSPDRSKLDGVDLRAGLLVGFLARTFGGGFAVKGKDVFGFSWDLGRRWTDF